MASTKKPRPSELPERLTTFLREIVQPGQTLLVGLSGGLDSCVLLHLLSSVRARLDFQLRACHVHHGISPNADDWAEFCAALCADCDIPFTVESVDVPRGSGLGVEATARAARYRVLLAQPADALVLAHHRDDQAETLLLQLLRGSGVKGLAAMPIVAAQTRTQGGGSMTVLRPLLDVARAELEAYAEAHTLRWIEDESNLDLAYDRNFLRHHVFPEIEQRFPAARTTLARSAAHFAEAAELLDEIATADAARYVVDRGLEIAGLRALTASRGRNLLRYWLADHLPASPSTRRLYELQRQLLTARADAQLLVAMEGGTVRRYRGRAFFERTAAPIAQELLWRGESVLQLPGGRLTFEPAVGKGLAAARVAEGLAVRLRSGGERLRPDSRRPTRSLRQLFQESGVPPWQRETLPLLYAGETLVAVPGVGIACDWLAAANEPGWLIDWTRD